MSVLVTEIGPMMRHLEQMPWTWIYFVQEGADGHVKIGKTENLRARLHALRNANPRPLRLIALWWAPEVCEPALHEMFSSARVRGEWFHATEELLRFARHPAFHCDEAMAEVA